MSNDPRTLGQSLVFQHDLVIICGACKSANACINYYGKILKKKYIYIYIYVMEKPANK